MVIHNRPLVHRCVHSFIVGSISNFLKNYLLECTPWYGRTTAVYTAVVPGYSYRQTAAAPVAWSGDDGESRSKFRSTWPWIGDLDSRFSTKFSIRILDLYPSNQFSILNLASSSTKCSTSSTKFKLFRSYSCSLRIQLASILNFDTVYLTKK